MLGNYIQHILGNYRQFILGNYLTLSYGAISDYLKQLSWTNLDNYLIEWMQDRVN